MKVSVFRLIQFCVVAMFPWTSVAMSADDATAALFVPHQYPASNGLDLNYRLMSPSDPIPEATYPLILFLHGSGERGSDNAVQLKHVVQELATPEMRETYPCFVMVPQCPEGQQWASIDKTIPGGAMAATPSLSLKACHELITKMIADQPVDPRRIYIVGLSMGGYGTWDGLQRWPEFFAAGVPICGGGDPNCAEQIVDTPIWVFHGRDDVNVPVERSQKMVNRLTELKGKVIYTEYVGVAHDCWTQTAQNRLVWDWLFAQKKMED